MDHREQRQVQQPDHRRFIPRTAARTAKAAVIAAAPNATPLTTDAATTTPVNKPGLGNNRTMTARSL